MLQKWDWSNFVISYLLKKWSISLVLQSINLFLPFWTLSSPFTMILTFFATFQSFDDFPPCYDGVHVWWFSSMLQWGSCLMTMWLQSNWKPWASKESKYRWDGFIYPFCISFCSFILKLNPQIIDLIRKLNIVVLINFSLFTIFSASH